MKRFRLPWYVWPWPHVPKLLAQREQARRIAEQLATELDVTQEAASMLLTEFGELRQELNRRERESRINRNNRLARSAASRQLIQSTAAAISAAAEPRRKQRA